MKDKKILIVDDDPRNIFALKATLKSRAYDCVTCEDAKTAINIVKKEKIDLVLLDMMMPEMDGYEALPLIKEGSVNKDLPVVAVTAQAMTGDRERCLSAGADEYVSKPVNVDKLMVILERFIHADS